MKEELKVNIYVIENIVLMKVVEQTEDATVKLKQGFAYGGIKLTRGFNPEFRPNLVCMWGENWYGNDRLASLICADKDVAYRYAHTLKNAVDAFNGSFADKPAREVKLNIKQIM